VIFKSAQIRLTLWYVLIVMMISLTFSVVVYLISFREIGIFNNHQSVILRRNPAFGTVQPPFRIEDIEDARNQELETLKRHLIENLAFTNLIILILSAAASFALAKRTLRPIEEMMEIQNRFTADASHELRTPLAAMKVGIEVALRDKGLALTEAKDLLKSNLEEIDRMKELSSNLLETAQFRNYNDSKFSDFSIAEAIQSSFKKIDKLAKAKNIEILIKAKDGQITADKSKIIQLVTIFLDNAVKYSANDKKIWLTGEVSKRNVSITIKDEGAGIKKQDLPFIFNRFYQANQARNKDSDMGYGLGLAIAKQIIEQHHGTISVESAEGVGTTFRLKLPLSS